MKQVLLLLSIVLLFFTVNAEAQLKPAQSQYLVEKGVLINPSFEQGYKGWVITGCTKSLVTETPYLDKSLKLTCTNETFSIKQVSASLIDFKNQQGAFDLQIKTTASGVNVSSITNGARDNAYSVLDSTTFKRFKEIGFIVGDTNNGIEVYSDTNFTGEIIVDNFKLGLGNLTQDIGAAHFVGRLTMKTDCQFTRTSSGYGYSIDATGCNPSPITGEVSTPDDNTRAGVKIINPRTDGFYQVIYTGLLYKVPATGTCDFTWSKTTSQEDNGESGLYSTAGGSSNSTLSGTFKFDNGEDGTVYILTSSTSSAACNIYGQNSNSSDISVHFFPDSKSTIATQSTTLTAKTANDLTFTGSYVSGTTTHTLVDDIYGVVGSVTSLSSSGFRVNFASGLFTQTPKVNCEPHDSSGSQARFLVYSINTNSFTVQNYGFSGAVDTFDGSYDCTITKHSADYNKSQTIVGSFEQIENINTELTTETANTFTAKLNGTTCAVESKDYDWITSTTDATTGACVVDFSGLGLTVIPSISVHIQFAGGIKYEASANASLNTVTMFSYNTAFNPADPVRYYIRITKQDADFNKSVKGAIVSVSDQARKCSTYPLSGNIISSANIPDWNISNIEDGRCYTITANVSSSGCYPTFVNNGSSFLRGILNNNPVKLISGSTIVKKLFGDITASSSNCSGSVVLFGNNSTMESFLQVCKEPATTLCD